MRRAFERDVLDYAESASASRLAPVAKRRAEWYTGATLSERHAHARAGRCVTLHDHDDGMSTLAIHAPSVLLHAAYDRLTQYATVITHPSLPSESDGRVPGPGVDHVRTDVACDMLLTGDVVAYDGTVGVAAITPIVQVTVPVLTLVDDAVADPFEIATLDGRIPIDPGTARALAAGAPGWERILTHPITAHPLSTDRYRPTEGMRRFLRVRDQHCRFPGCGQPARRADIDHTVDHAHGGPTHTGNLAHICRRHHTLKHHTPWTVRQRSDGVLEWTSPTGRTYTDHPTGRVAFTTDPQHDPTAHREPWHTPVPTDAPF
ncbi:HNH endonuclease signature motif containing protein [Microbacterium sp.]|uniref:HNH endonuclease signature motif containing protein n=1 Tax=Microbacterium sp. TaxID=51671 RepID=UPI003A888FA2